MGEMRSATAQEEADRRAKDRFPSILVIAAATMAAVRLGRDQDLANPVPRVSLCRERRRELSNAHSAEVTG